MYEVTCQRCGDVKFRKMPTARYCSEVCRKRDERSRRAKRMQKLPVITRLVSCRSCGVEFETAGAHQYCSDTCRMRVQEIGDHFAAPGTCRRCGGDRGKWSTFCDSCKSARRRETRRLAKARGRIQDADWSVLNSHRQRARHYGVEFVSGIRRDDIAERDSWKCGICGDYIDRNIDYPDPMSRSLDHIVPMARGGGHVPDNLQIAHWLCNSVKSDNLEFETRTV